MECAAVRLEHPDTQIPPCCESCHEDDAMGYGGDLWAVIGGRDRHVCCVVMRAFEKP